MIAHPSHFDPTTAVWFKASYSSGDQNCLETARNLHVVPVRDSKRPEGPVLLFQPSSWAKFVVELASHRAVS
ncbi:DUF397 domain-containing protein [Streptomyces sp. NPDC016845]|uniref:DUF397 domain-containing protein n=1 Tax=Streptomyces sp. NPDC016845 TaxID=3364972 RepID=UPI0037BBA670